MGRPPKNRIEEPKVEKLEKPIEAVVPEEPKVSVDEIMQKKAIIDASNSEKIKKDVMQKRANELESYIKHLQDRSAEIALDYENKRKALLSLSENIAGANFELSMLQKTFSEKNASLIKDYQKKLSDVEATDKTLKRLVAENEALNKENRLEKGMLAEYKHNCDMQVYEMKKALDQNLSESSKKEADLLAREEALKKEKEEFEAYKQSLAPEQARISAIKNENLLLIQKIEDDRKRLDGMMAAVQLEKNRANEAKALSDRQIKQMHDAQVNEDARLRKWESDIRDLELEVEAKRVELNKELRRAHLQEIAKG